MFPSRWLQLRISGLEVRLFHSWSVVRPYNSPPPPGSVSSGLLLLVSRQTRPLENRYASLAVQRALLVSGAVDKPRWLPPTDARLLACARIPSRAPICHANQHRIYFFRALTSQGGSQRRSSSPHLPQSRRSRFFKWDALQASPYDTEGRNKLSRTVEISGCFERVREACGSRLRFIRIRWASRDPS